MDEEWRRRWTAFAALTAAGCFWGTGFFFGKIALREMGVGHMVLYRLGFGSVALLPFAFRSPMRIRRGDLRLFLYGAFLGFPVQFLVQFDGLARTSVAHASLMVAMAPLLIAAGAVLFMGERLDRIGWLMLATSTAGALLIGLGAGAGHGPDRATALGDALVGSSLLAGVAWVLISKRLMEPAYGYSAFAVNFYMLALGTLLLAAWVLPLDGLPPVRLSAIAWVAVIVPGVVTTALGNLLWNWALTRVPASRAGVFVNLEPVIGTLLGLTLLHEMLGKTALLGGVMVVGAAVFFTLRRGSGRVAGD